MLIFTLERQFVFKLDVVAEGVNSGINLFDVILFDDDVVTVICYKR